MTHSICERLRERVAREIVRRHCPPELVKLNGRELMPVEGAVLAVCEALAGRETP